MCRMRNIPKLIINSNTMIKKTLATLFLLIIAIPSNAIIPEFEALYTKEYYSANGLYMVRIIPEFIPNRYYKWKDSNPYRKKLFTEKDTTIIPCHAQFYQITTTDTL